jgi:Fic family protein
MDWSVFRLSKRLHLSAALTEKIYDVIAQTDAVKNSWQLTDRLMPQTIKRITQGVIVTSTGASNRIEGNQLTDAQVEALYKNLRIKKFKTRDEQEVAGYLGILETIFSHHAEIPIKEQTILQLHRDTLKFSDKDKGHKGKYKLGSNRVEARDQNGKLVGIIFDPTPPHLVPKEMRELCEWYVWAVKEKFKHPLLLIANFIFEYLAIHPFQDGNGRTSRLLTNLMLLQHGYQFTAAISHEKLIEDDKANYYLALNKAQKTWKSKKEDVSPWLLFIFDIFRLQANKALTLLQGDNIENVLSEKQLALWQWANSLADKKFTRKMAIDALGFPARTVEASIKKLFDLKKIERHGEGRSVRYQIKRND